MKKYLSKVILFITFNIFSINAHAIIFDVLDDLSWSSTTGLSFTIFGVKDVYSRIACAYYIQNLTKFNESNKITETFEIPYTESAHFSLPITNSINCDEKNNIFLLLIQCNSNQEPSETSAYVHKVRDRCKL